MAQTAIVADINKDLLTLQGGNSDRFVYSNCFIPLALTFDGTVPIFTHVQRALLQRAVDQDPSLAAKARSDPSWSTVFEKNKITVPPEQRMKDSNTEETTTPGVISTRLLLQERLRSTRANLSLVRDQFRESSGESLRILEHNLDTLNDAAEQVQSEMERMTFGPAPTGKTAEGSSLPNRSIISEIRQANDGSAVHDISEIIAGLKSELGYVFLDRTRIRPKGFKLGEPVFALSLAPNEEVVLEQKTYTKRQATFEEQTEQETQFDLELSSSFTTEMQESLQLETSHSEKSGLNAGLQLSVSGGDLAAAAAGGAPGADSGSSKAPAAGGPTLNATLDCAKEINDANSRTRNQSLKQSVTASSKVASRARTQHKIDIKIVSEVGMETGSRRVIKNPNKYTSLNLHYFKLLQNLEIVQERYGVRLCWAPSIKDPGGDLFRRINEAKQAIRDDALKNVAYPAKPVAPAMPTLPPKTGNSARLEANQWGFWDDMSADYTLSIGIDKGYIWDGDAGFVNVNVHADFVNVDRSHSYGIVGVPWVEYDASAGQNILKVTVHVGVDWQATGKRGNVYLSVSARLVADPQYLSPEYQQAYIAYQQQLAQWNQQVADLNAAALEKASQRADELAVTILADANPVQELITSIISHLFPAKLRDEMWEIDLWQKLFNWDECSVTMYPAWWSGSSLRDVTHSSSHFFNASWAKLYVPIRPGSETLALRWIIARKTQQLNAATEQTIQQTVDELRRYRQQQFGGTDEFAISQDDIPAISTHPTPLGKWEEVLPTDGTHVEAIQSMTLAADDISLADVQESKYMNDTLLDGHKQDVELKKKVLTQMAGQPTVEVRIRPEELAHVG